MSNIPIEAMTVAQSLEGVLKICECCCCFEVYCDERWPIFMDCGHIVCNVCYGRHLEASQHANCPTCRATFENPNREHPTVYQLWDVAKIVGQHWESWGRSFCRECESFLCASDRRFCGPCFDKVCVENTILSNRYVYKKMSPYEKILHYQKKNTTGFGRIQPLHVVLEPGQATPPNMQPINGSPKPKRQKVDQSRESTPSPVRHPEGWVPPAIHSPDSPAADSQNQASSVDSPSTSHNARGGVRPNAEENRRNAENDEGLTTYVRLRRTIMNHGRQQTREEEVVDLTVD